MAREKKENAPVTEEELIKRFTNVKPGQERIQKNIKQDEPENNTLTLHNGLNLTIKPTKLKYFRDGDYILYKLFENYTTNELLNYSDGYTTLCRFLSAVFDKPYTILQVKNETTEEYASEYVFDQSIKQLVDEDLALYEIDLIIQKSLRINKINDENFQKPLAKE